MDYQSTNVWVSLILKPLPDSFLQKRLERFLRSLFEKLSDLGLEASYIRYGNQITRPSATTERNVKLLRHRLCSFH